MNKNRIPLYGRNVSKCIWFSYHTHLYLKLKFPVFLSVIQLAHLSPSLYPEYTKIYRLMTGKQSNPLYRKLTNSQIIAFDSNIALLKTPDGLKSVLSIKNSFILI